MLSSIRETQGNAIATPDAGEPAAADPKPELTERCQEGKHLRR